MKNVLLAAIACISLAACAQPKTIDGVQYRPYGLFNEQERKNPKIDYDVSIGSVVAAVIFCETVIVPIYVVGWDTMEPTGPKLITSPH